MKPIALCFLVFCLLPSTAAPARAEGGATRVSATGLFLAGYTKREDPGGAPTSRTGLYGQRVEICATAPLGSGVTADLGVALPGAGGVLVTEGFVTAFLAGDLELKAGRFYADLGRHNLLHPQRFPFLDPPLVVERLFGEEGLSEVGFGLRQRLPLPWRADLSGQVLNGDNPLWRNPTDEDLLFVAHLRNLWGPGESFRAQLGGSLAWGANAEERSNAVVGADLALEFSPRGRADRALTWQAEYLHARQTLRVTESRRGGLYTFLQYQFARRWWAQARYDFYGLPQERAEGWEDRFSALLRFEPNRLLPLRFQYSRWRVEQTGRGYNQYHIQLHFTLEESVHIGGEP